MPLDSAEFCESQNSETPTIDGLWNTATSGFDEFNGLVGQGEERLYKAIADVYALYSAVGGSQERWATDNLYRNQIEEMRNPTPGDPWRALLRIKGVKFGRQAPPNPFLPLIKHLIQKDQHSSGRCTKIAQVLCEADDEQLDPDVVGDWIADSGGIDAIVKERRARLKGESDEKPETPQQQIKRLEWEIQGLREANESLTRERDSLLEKFREAEAWNKAAPQKAA